MGSKNKVEVSMTLLVLWDYILFFRFSNSVSQWTPFILYRNKTIGLYLPYDLMLHKKPITFFMKINADQETKKPTHKG